MLFDCLWKRWSDMMFIFRLEAQEEIFFNQKQRAAQREVPAELGEWNHATFSFQFCLLTSETQTLRVDFSLLVCKYQSVRFTETVRHNIINVISRLQLLSNFMTFQIYISLLLHIGKIPESNKFCSFLHLFNPFDEDRVVQCVQFI